jgi:hypothetical protein
MEKNGITTLTVCLVDDGTRCISQNSTNEARDETKTKTIIKGIHLTLPHLMGVMNRIFNLAKNDNCAIT